VRVLTFPAVAAIAAILALLIVLRTPIAADAAQHRWAADLLAVAMLGIGGLFALPMLGVDILPNWCTPPVRFVLAFVDGLLDAVPGIVIMTGTGTLAGGFYDRIQLPWSTGAYTDRQIAGGMMLSVSEVVAVPLTIALFRAWIREDEQLARQADQEPVAPGPADIAAPDGTPAGTGLQRPWWEVDPGGLGAEGHRRGWARQSPHDR
jgi:putative copper resistance protein D